MSHFDSRTISPNDALKNFLLAALPKIEFERIKYKLEPTFYKLGAVLYEAGEQVDYAYFPTTAIVSMLYITENGATAEIGIVGNDGMVGNALFMGGETTTNRAVIQSAARFFG